MELLRIVGALLVTPVAHGTADALFEDVLEPLFIGVAAEARNLLDGELCGLQAFLDLFQPAVLDGPVDG